MPKRVITISGSRERFEYFHRRLNCAEIVSNKFYRRNTIWYPLVSYVNTIIALFISDNLEGIPTFVNRVIKAHDEITAHSNLAKDEGSEYLKMVGAYLCLVVEHLYERGLCDRQRVTSVKSWAEKS